MKFGDYVKHPQRVLKEAMPTPLSFRDGEEYKTRFLQPVLKQLQMNNASDLGKLFQQFVSQTVDYDIDEQVIRDEFPKDVTKLGHAFASYLIAQYHVAQSQADKEFLHEQKGIVPEVEARIEVLANLAAGELKSAIESIQHATKA